jgi:hypothetical protein
LLQVRNRAEAARREREIKAELEAKGEPSDHVHVEPGSVDWLWGEKKPNNSENYQEVCMSANLRSKFHVVST